MHHWHVRARVNVVPCHILFINHASVTLLFPAHHPPGGLWAKLNDRPQFFSSPSHANSPRDSPFTPRPSLGGLPAGGISESSTPQSSSRASCGIPRTDLHEYVVVQSMLLSCFASFTVTKAAAPTLALHVHTEETHTFSGSVAVTRHTANRPSSNVRQQHKCHHCRRNTRSQLYYQRNFFAGNAGL